MTRRGNDPLRLDVAALARDGATVEGSWPLVELGRLLQSQTPPQDAPAGTVAWSATGEQRSASGEPPQVWLHLKARTTVWLTCQRCLAPMQVDLAVESAIRFVRGEAQAEALDAESEYDVLALSPAVDLRQLAEDELLLAMPLVPRHAACPAPLLAPTDDGDRAADAHAPVHPFAVLEGLKARRGR